MNFFNPHNLKAAGLHLVISLTIAALCLLLVYQVWYRSPLDEALNVGSLFLLILFVDIVLGPLMTLVVFKPNKPSLTFDLTVIACVQLAALLYGLHTVGSGRPAYMVFTKDRFDLVLAYEVPTIAGTPAKPELVMQNPWAQPLKGYQLKSATAPSGAEHYPTLDLIMASALSGGPDIPHVPAFHRDYREALPNIRATAATFNTLNVADFAIKARANELLKKYPADSLLSPLKIKYTIYTVVMRPSDAAILGIEPVDVF